MTGDELEEARHAEIRRRQEAYRVQNGGAAAAPTPSPPHTSVEAPLFGSDFEDVEPSEPLGKGAIDGTPTDPVPSMPPPQGPKLDQDQSTAASMLTTPATGGRLAVFAALLALGTSVFAFTGGWWWGLAAVILGHVSYGVLARKKHGGRVFAVLGLILGYLGILIAIIGFFVGQVQNAAESLVDSVNTSAEQAAEQPEPQLVWLSDAYCAADAKVIFEGETASFQALVCRASDDSLTYVGGNAELGYIALPARDRGGYWAAGNESTTYGVSETALSAIDDATGSYVVDEAMEWSAVYE